MYRVKRLRKDATGTNTINIYHPLQMDAEFRGGEESNRMAATVAIPESDHQILHADFTSSESEWQRITAGIDVPAVAHSVLDADIQIPSEAFARLDANLRDGPLSVDPVLNTDIQIASETFASLAADIHVGAAPLIPALETAIAVPVQSHVSATIFVPPSPPEPREPDVDAQAMAQAMREASELGVPFCEKCTRARLDQQRKAAAPSAAPAPRVAPVEDSPDVANLEAKAMADALKDAARKGVPFCEECTRAQIRARAKS